MFIVFDMGGMICVGLVGYGFVGKMFYVLLIGVELGLMLVVVVLCDVDKVYVDWLEVVVFVDLVDFFVVVDLVVIVLFNDMYVLLVWVVLLVGKVVVVDKLFMFDMVEVWDLIVVVGWEWWLLLVFYNWWWDSDYFSVKVVIGDGLVGMVVYFELYIDWFWLVVC